MGKHRPSKGQQKAYSAPVSLPPSPQSSAYSSREPSPQVLTKPRVRKMAVPMGAKLGMGVMGALGMLGAGYGIGA